MDLSKLPKFSNSPPPPPAAPESVPPTPPGVPTTYLPGGRYCPACGQPIRHQARFCDSCGQPLASAVPPAEAMEGLGLQAIVSIVVALFILFMQPRLPQYLMHRLTGSQGSNFFNPDGTTIAYFRDGQPFVNVYTATVEFLGDLGPFAFAVMLVIDALVLAFARRPGIMATALALTAIVSLYNLGYFVLTFATYGPALISFLAAAFGAFMCWQQWTLLRGLRQPA